MAGVALWNPFNFDALAGRAVLLFRWCIHKAGKPPVLAVGQMPVGAPAVGFASGAAANPATLQSAARIPDLPLPAETAPDCSSSVLLVPSGVPDFTSYD